MEVWKVSFLFDIDFISSGLRHPGPAWTLSQTPEWPLDSSSPFVPDSFAQGYQSNLPFHQVSLLFKRTLQWFPVT